MTVADIRPLRVVSFEQLEAIIEKFALSTAPKEDLEEFVDTLAKRRDALFYEIGDVGLVYFVNVIPEFHGTLRFVFWDGRIGRHRLELITAVLATAFETLKFVRINAVALASQEGLIGKYKKLGFFKEGVIRRGSLSGEDQHLYGMLREELPWHAMPIRTNTSG